VSLRSINDTLIETKINLDGTLDSEDVEEVINRYTNLLTDLHLSPFTTKVTDVEDMVSKSNR